jgi:basic amino acid/polyamine antiporter, APA family
MAQKFKNLLGTFDLTMIVVSLVIGMGIFRSSFNVAKDAGSPAIFFLAWILGGVIALFGALTFAEIGSRYPVTGGFYKIYSYCYHPALAFMINGIILISNAASVSAVALIGAGYLRGMLPVDYQTETVVQIVALAAVIVFFFVNYLGFKMSVKTQNVLMVVKILIVLFICAGLLFPAYPDTPVQEVAGAPGFWGQVKALGAALIAVSFTYGGYQQTINFGGEVQHPQRTIPRSIFFGIAIIVSLYLLTNWAYFHTLGFNGIVYNAAGIESRSDLAARHVQTYVGSSGYNIMSLLLFFAVLAYVNIGLMSNPRVIYAMADEGVMPRFLKKVNEKSQVLVYALPVFAAVAVITLFFARTFEEILDYVIFLDSIGLATAVASIFILRRKTAHLDNTNIYKMKGYPWMPIIYILAYAFVSLSIILRNPKSALIGFAMFLGFYPLYLLSKKLNQSRNGNKRNPE